MDSKICDEKKKNSIGTKFRMKTIVTKNLVTKKLSKKMLSIAIKFVWEFLLDERWGGGWMP